MRLSELYGKEIYTQRGMYVDKVEDIILDIKKGEVMQLCFKPLKGVGLSAETGKRILQTESIGYNEVVAVDDIILCQKAPSVPRKPATTLKK
jgi:sporulation protein YlmC with PRC-barrel domain